MSVIGSFNSSGSPVIEISVSGPVTNPTQFIAMVDTGFTGFLMLPLLQAFPVGLILNGTMPITLADGSTQTKLTCLGELHFDGESQIGLIIIEPNSTDILVGMDFLRKFERELLVDPINNLVRLTKTVPIVGAASAPAISTVVTASPPPPTNPPPAQTT
jgi:predicted aspartyl protease